MAFSSLPDVTLIARICVAFVSWSSGQQVTATSPKLLIAGGATVQIRKQDNTFQAESSALIQEATAKAQ